MSLYNQCLQLVNISQSTKNVENNTSLYLSETNNSTLPRKLQSEFPNDRFLCNCVYYISDIHLAHKIVTKFKKKASDEQVKDYVKKIAVDLISKSHVGSHSIILFGGDISSFFVLSKIFYTEFIKQLEKKDFPSESSRTRKRFIYAILGNHEFWDFETTDDCYIAYKELFDTLGITFLHNTFTWLGKHRTPLKEIKDSDGRTQYVELKKNENTDEYEKQMRYIFNTVIVGGVGFAGYNNEFNANMRIYNKALTREQEIEETLKWEKTYYHALSFAKETNSVLVVLTHNPIPDWKENGIGNGGCVYFNGHTHQDYLYHDENKTLHIFANNQIGYKNTNIQFRQAYIYNRLNPFGDYEDGYHKISGAPYLRFYDHMIERIRGIGSIERHIKANNASFYMIKHDGYYGFFLVSSKGTSICVGGRTKKISESSNIKQFDTRFMQMIRQYKKLLTPYRTAQEQIAKSVKDFGGDGTIHGCIVDIDFFNHIMLDPSNGNVTYYHSPIYGVIEKYDNLMSLLDKHNKELATQYRKQLKDQGVVSQNQIDPINKMIQLNIKDSIYAFSNRLNQLQRLFDNQILRDWNENLLFNNISDERLTLPDTNSSNL